jgi:hypothetical protein
MTVEVCTKLMRLRPSYMVTQLFIGLLLSACGGGSTGLPTEEQVSAKQESAQQESAQQVSAQQVSAQQVSAQQVSAQQVSVEKLEYQSPFQAKSKLGYPQYTILSKYGSEQKLGVKYFNSNERSALKITVKDGLLYNSKGEKLDPQLDQPKHAGRSGKAIFTISVDGQFWVCFDQRYGYIHHSSLLAGAPVLSAGELVLEDGQLLSISNASGHYKPPAKSLDVALKLLAEMGVNLSEVERFELGPSGMPVRTIKERSIPNLLDNLPKPKQKVRE